MYIQNGMLARANMARNRSLVILFFLTLFSTTQAFSQQTYAAPKTPDGHPDLQGIWQVLNTANYSILEFACYEGEKDLEHYTPDTGKK